ncbi:MAG: hypothetical protein M5U09_17575 [Gammaproteobacteria bacterium]|nr:hypothetical protein [Gammaproteobacteria bacterium]
MRRAMPPVLGAALLAGALAGCYASASPDGSADGALLDAATPDGRLPGDGATNGDANVDGGNCPQFGTTRACRPQCGLPCPAGSICGGVLRALHARY